MITNTYCNIPSLRLLRLTGDDRLMFLHSQLTRDLTKLAVGQAGLSAWCNPKGRVIATLFVCRAEDYIDLLVAADLKDAVLKRLRMYVLRAKVEIRDCETATVMELTGDELLTGVTEQTTLPVADWQFTEHGRVTYLRLPGSIPRQLVYGDSDAVQALSSEFAEHAQTVSENYWTLLNIESRLPWIDSKVTEQFLPQMLNLDQSGGLDFNKGCYPGQEVIARLHYRGEVKQRLQYGITGAATEPGAALYTDNGERAGALVNCAEHPDGNSRCLAVAATGTTRLHVNASDGPIVDFMP